MTGYGLGRSQGNQDGPDHSGLGAYVLGLLEDDEARQVEEHISGCADCQAEITELRAVRERMDEVPPEAFLNGPPDNDLLLQRTLRQIRAESGSPIAQEARFVRAPRRGRALLVAAAVAILAAGGVVGGVIGRQTAPQPPVAAAPPANQRILTGRDAGTGAAVTVAVTPQAGWVRIHATVTGVKAGTPCEIVVQSRGGQSVVAGSWLVSATGAKKGTVLDGTALVPADDVAAVLVQTLAGQHLVSANAAGA